MSHKHHKEFHDYDAVDTNDDTINGNSNSIRNGSNTSNSIKRKTLSVTIDDDINNRIALGLQSPLPINNNNNNNNDNSIPNSPQSPSSSSSSIKRDRRLSNATNNNTAIKRSSQIFMKPMEESQVADLKAFATTDITLDKDSIASKAIESTKSSSSSKNATGKEINQGHDLYALTYGMMLGIRVMTSNHAKITNARQLNSFVGIIFILILLSSPQPQNYSHQQLP